MNRTLYGLYFSILKYDCILFRHHLDTPAEHAHEIRNGIKTKTKNGNDKNVTQIIKRTTMKQQKERIHFGAKQQKKKLNERSLACLLCKKKLAKQTIKKRSGKSGVCVCEAREFCMETWKQHKISNSNDEMPVWMGMAWKKNRAKCIQHSYWTLNAPSTRNVCANARKRASERVRQNEGL